LILVEQERLELPNLLIWRWTHCCRLRRWHILVGEDLPAVYGVTGRVFTSCFRLALLPGGIILVERMALLHCVSLTLILIFDMEASEADQRRVAFHVVPMDLRPELHSSVPACGACLTEEG